MNIHQAHDLAISEYRDKITLQEKLIANVARSLNVEPKDLLGALMSNYVDLAIGQVTQLVYSHHYWQDKYPDPDDYWVVNRWR